MHRTCYRVFGTVPYKLRDLCTAMHRTELSQVAARADDAKEMTTWHVTDVEEAPANHFLSS